MINITEANKKVVEAHYASTGPYDSLGLGDYGTAWLKAGTNDAGSGPYTNLESKEGEYWKMCRLVRRAFHSL